jgi:quinol monooxygenase YgiN
MSFSKAEYQKEELIAGMPPVPEGEFCVFGIVSSIDALNNSHLPVQVYAYPEHADALEAVYAETTRLAASEPGTIYYCISRDPDDRTVFHFFERYAGRAAFEEHNAQPIIKKLIQDKLFKGVKAKFVEAIEPASA